MTDPGAGGGGGAPGQAGPEAVEGAPPGRTAVRVRRTWAEWLVTPALLLGAVLALAGASVFVPAAKPEDLVAFAVLLPLEVVGIAVALRLLARSGDRSFLLRLVLAGFLLRLGLALAVHATLPVSFFAPDQLTFQDVGWRTLQYLRGLGPLPMQIRGVEVGYFYWNAGLFALFGQANVAPKLVNCMLGAVAGLVAYRVGGELAGARGARNAAFLVTLFPSLVLWSTQNLRDTPAVLLLLLVLWVALRLRVRATATRAVALVGLLALLAVLRDYMAVMAVFAVAGSFLVSEKRGVPVNVFIVAGLFAVAILAYRGLDLGDGMDSVSFEMLNEQRRNLATGRTAFAPETDISTPLQGLRFLPVGLAFFLLSPFPWQIESSLSLMTLPEQAIWYLLLPMVVYGGWFLLRERFNRVAPALLFVVLTTAVYALVEGNAGTAYRHRAQIVVFMLIFAGVGLDVWRVRRRARRGGKRARMAPPPLRELRKPGEPRGAG